MRFGIITYHRAINYGAVLQAYALKEFIIDNGHSAEIIDYRNKYIEDNYKILKRHKGERVIPFLARLILCGVIQFRKNKKFEHFRNTYLNLSNPCDLSNISEIVKDYDYIITGSDQVFAPQYSGFDEVFLLRNVCENRKKYSYAASFGANHIIKTVIEWLADDLKSFNKLSVREKSAVSELERIFGIVASRNIDPVFLIDSDKWQRVIHKPAEEKYILIYTINNSHSVVKAAQKLAKETGYKIIYLNDKYYKKIKNVHYATACSPEDFLSFFYYSEYVFTTSFHGVAFSIIYHKKFFVDYCLGENKGDRITELLSHFKMEDCTCQSYLRTGEIVFFDWDNVDKVIREEQIRSKSYLGI